MIKILLKEPEVVIRENIKLKLKQIPGVVVAAEVISGSEIIELFKRNNFPDLILYEWTTPESDSLNWIGVLKEKYPAIPIVLLTMLNHSSQISKAFKLGVSGYLLRNINEEELSYALSHTARGGIYLSSELTHQLIKAIISVINAPTGIDGACDFTTSEIALMQALGDGLTNKEIGEKVFLSKRSIETHRAQLMKKVGVKNTALLIKFAVKEGYIE